MSSILSKLINLAGNITGTLAISHGGTGQATANTALNALLPSQTGNNGKLLSTDGSNTSWATGLTSALTSAHLLIGNVSNVATDTAVTGDVTITNAGVTALGSTIAGAKTWSGAQTFSGGYVGNAPTVMNFSAFNPTNLSGTNTNATAVSTQNNPAANGITISGIVSGTVTYTFANTGWYRVDLTTFNTHAAAATDAEVIFTIAGSATSLNQSSTIYLSALSPNGGDNAAEAFMFMTHVTSATQTLTVQMTYAVVGSGTTANHTAAGQVNISVM